MPTGLIPPLVLALVLGATTLSAQAPQRHAANVTAAAHPGSTTAAERHRRHHCASDNGELRVNSESERLGCCQGGAPEGLNEIRGGLDLGRMNPYTPGSRLRLEDRVHLDPGSLAAAGPGDGARRKRDLTGIAAARADHPRDGFVPLTLPRTESHHRRPVCRPQSPGRPPGRARKKPVRFRVALG